MKRENLLWPDDPPEVTHAEWSRSLGRPHCTVCGGRVNASGRCLECGAGLACRADTTDTVAPDPPCFAFRSRDV